MPSSPSTVLTGTAKYRPNCFLSPKQTLRFEFADFPSINDKWVDSPSLLCHGHKWSFSIYPRGNPEGHNDSENSTKGWVSAYLEYGAGSEHDTADAMVSFEYCGEFYDLPRHQFKQGDNSTWGYPQLGKREKVINQGLEQTTFVIHVNIQVYQRTPFIWKPANTLVNDMVEMLHSGGGSDIKFEFTNSEKSLLSHKTILACRSPMLLEHEGPGNTITIDGADPEVFRALLYFLYSGELQPNFDMKADGMKLLQLANRFECTNLKLLVEAKVVETVLSAENAADTLLLADSHSCALLHEAAIGLLASNPGKTMMSSGWDTLKESGKLMGQIFEASHSGKSSSLGDDEDSCCYKVSSLRRKLSEIGQDVDGTLETLQKRLLCHEKDDVSATIV